MTEQNRPGHPGTFTENEAFPPLSRTPRPYSHGERSNARQNDAPADGHLRPPAMTPSSSDSERSARSPDDSGTEADDEALTFTRALPAPNTRPSKGLKLNFRVSLDDSTPFLTPSQLNEDNRSVASGYFEEDLKDQEKVRREKFARRRRAELVRRVCELLSFGLVGTLVFKGHLLQRMEIISEKKHHETLHAIASPQWTALLTHIGTTLFLLLLYPIRLLLIPLKFGSGFRLGTIEVPASFDPAPFLYPSFLPVLTALSIYSADSSIIIINITLGLSALPPQLIPTFGTTEEYNPIHWLVTLCPTFVVQYLFPACILFGGIEHDAITYLFPMHQTLLPILQHLTTTSLLSSEVQLLTTALINVLLTSRSPQSNILMILLWVGGLGLFILCASVLRWNVALERIPSWRFRRADQKNKTSKSFFFRFLDRISAKDQTTLVGNDSGPRRPVQSHRAATSKAIPVSPTKDSALAHSRPRSRTASRVGHSEFRPIDIAQVGSLRHPLRRTQTAPITFATSSKGRKRTLSTSAQAYFSMTTREVEIRKWTYAIYTYVVTLFLIFVPIRSLVAAWSMHGPDPFSWAIGYLFGDISALRDFVSTYELENWVYSPSSVQEPGIVTDHFGRLQRLRYLYGVSNTRLVLFAYWATIVVLGVASVLQLSSVADVDTRRKVFHGMMVIMLLPTTYIDPCFLSLALILVLAVFLLLDLFRAAQLRPLSKPLARFLTPYVDGRDLRGPVVISHIFLLIGCAIPFWLSLADSQPTGDGWELATRDVSMVAGVICVGMGDAAASLIGRRYGKRKWPWAGGKSLEGSAAFAFAVTLGLLLGKAWLKIGGWSNDRHTFGHGWLMDIGKASLAAGGASFTEAVLTGANDNVVVPIVLWLLVKALKL